MIPCSVYRSERRPETYLYLAEEQEFKDLPLELQQLFGEPVLVMTLELDSGRQLARVSVHDVLRGLANEGYYLQLPPPIPTEEEISRMVRSRERQSR